MSKRLLFIHIPKTAGTSFRFSAQNHFGDQHTFFDYSPTSIETSSIILDYIYNQHDMYVLGQKFRKHDEMFLSGHFTAKKYAPLFNSLNTITFVRNPVEQVLSHYQHYISHLDYKKDLKHFVKERRFKNIQSRLLAGRPLELYGFIGLTEKYSQSVELINDYYDLNLEVLHANKSIAKKKSIDNQDDENIEFIKNENQGDVLLYNKVKAIFENRIEYYKKKKPFIHLLIQSFDKKYIRGLACQKDQELPLKIKIYNKDMLIGEVNTLEHRPGFLLYNLPRNGFIGFDYKLQNPNLDTRNIHLEATRCEDGF